MCEAVDQIRLVDIEKSVLYNFIETLYSNRVFHAGQFNVIVTKVTFNNGKSNQKFICKFHRSHYLNSGIIGCLFEITDIQG